MKWKRNIPKGLDLRDTVAPFGITPHLGNLQLVIELSNAPLDPTDTDPEELTAFMTEVEGWYKQGKKYLLYLLEEYEKNYSFTFIPETMLLGLMYVAKIIIEELAPAAEPTEASLGSNNFSEKPTKSSQTSEEARETLERCLRKQLLSGESLNVVLGDATKKRLDNLFSMGDGSRSKWIEQLYKADSILTLSLGHGTDSLVDVIQKLDSLKMRVLRNVLGGLFCLD
ncbi:hypothetical protein TWF506_000002 [Arthrobotrys conoides]|uniref:Uncharacterized protein n=1 Tax=Arthrobotrys conoides TaxID=74498 RepID=A0AAN8PQA8_9PEZI